MPNATPPPFDIDDAKSFDENVLEFMQSLSRDDATLAAALAAILPRIDSGALQISEIWDELEHALESEQS
jgi:hypothetical protein